MALMAHGGGGTRSPVTRSPLGNGSTAAGAAMGVELATGGRDGSIRVWDIRRTSVPLLELRGHTGPVTLLEAVPHTSIPGICGMHGGGLLTSGILVSGSEDWTVRIWDRQQSPTSPGQHGTCDHSSSAMHSTCSNGADDHCLAVLSGHGGPVSSAVVIPGSAASGSAPLLASGAKDGSVMVWDMTAAIASGGAHGCIWLGQAHRPGVPVTIIVPAVLPDQISSTSGNTGTPGKRAGGQGQGLHGTGSNAGHHQKASSYAARAAQQAAISPFSPTRWAPGAVTSGGSSTTSGAVSAPMFVSAAEDATCAVWAACSSTGHAMGSNGSHTQHDSQAECSGTHACTGQQHVQGYCRSTGGCPVAVVGFQGRCSRVPVPCAAYDASIGVMYTGGPQGVVKAWHYHSQAGL
jgi:WD40 repeat protein